jgi:cytochrome c oxidase subunit 4
MAGHDKKWQRLGDGKLLTEDPLTGLGHIVSIDVYKGVFISLVVLTIITVWAACQDFGVLNLFIAMGIASFKAGIVTLMFMHLNYESKIIWGIVIYPLFIFLLIVAGTMGDAAIKKQPIPHSLAPEKIESAKVFLAE